jgi:hypothetical protein
MLGTDVQRYIGGWMGCLEKRAYFLGAASTEFNDHALTNGGRNLGGTRLQQGNFGAGEAVFGLLADAIEEA